jgi:putative secretion ATPase (PEP-CTERM system associated)
MYNTFYKFTGKPFQLTPDPRFFFASNGHRRAMSYLRYGLSQSEGFIVITGGVGTGKTTLVRNLFAELDPERVVAAQLVTTQLEADDMLSLVVAAFGIDYQGVSKAVLIKRLETFLATCARRGKRVLLVVDEAQNLPARTLEELRMLSNFQISDAPLIQSFLLGQNQFRDTLQSGELEQLRQRIIASCHLNPLESEETRAYISHRLGVVGWQGDPEFSDEVFHTIHALTQGVPRRINVFCDRLLLFGYLEELHRFDEDTIREVAAELQQEFRMPDSDPGVGLSEKTGVPVEGTEHGPRESEEMSGKLDSMGSLSGANAGEVSPLEDRVRTLEDQVTLLQETVSSLCRSLKAR